MAESLHRVFNFSAGPGTLPVPVLEQCRDDMLNFAGTGMGIMEMSHRSAAYEKVLADAITSLRELMAIPSEYRVLFVQGGASLQFTMLPMNLLAPGKTGEYVVTGSWGKKAAPEAKRFGTSVTAYDGKSAGYRQTPAAGELVRATDAAYIHITSNETIEGVEFAVDPDFGTDSVPLVCDMSSDILSRPIDVARYGLIYAGAQKNMGPAGVTVVIVHQSLLDGIKNDLPPMLDYRIYAENDSMYNTPPTWSIYVCGLVYRHLLANGGLAAAAARNEAKSQTLYRAIDGSGGFYTGHADRASRSRMNVTFTLPTDELTSAFVKESTAAGLDGLKGHRSVGGIRASIYNAFPQAGCDALATFMADFAARNG